MALIAAVAIVLAASTSTRALQVSDLQPRTYVSPSGRCSLRVEPTERTEPKHATYVMTCDGRTIWRELHSFALWHATVTDDGRVAGITYSGSLRYAGGTMRVVLLSSQGEVLLDEPHERVSINISHASPRPVALHLFTQPELERFVVQVADCEGERGSVHFEACWVYDLRNGAALFQRRMEREAGFPGRQHVIDARALPGTPLTLLHWYRIDYSLEPWSRGGVFELVDADWNTVWSLELLHDYEVGGDRAAENVLEAELKRNGAVLSTGSSSFELRFVAERQRVRFVVERNGLGWIVRETGRTPWSEEVPPELPVLRPRLLSRITLGEADPPATMLQDLLGTPATARLDTTFGRILIVDRRSRAIHVFDATGRRLAICRPKSEEEKPAFELLGQMFCDQDGYVYVAARPFTSRYVRFAPDGTSEGVHQLQAGRATFLPNGGGYWGVSQGSLFFMNASGEPSIQVDKRSDGNWFRDIMDLAVAVDGSVAVLEGPRYARNAPADSVCLFGPRGEPKSVHSVPADLQARELDFAGGKILLIDGRFRAHLMDAASGALVRLDLDAELERGRSVRFGMSTDGTELWALEVWEHRFLRFQLE